MFHMVSWWLYCIQQPAHGISHTLFMSGWCLVIHLDESSSCCVMSWGDWVGKPQWYGWQWPVKGDYFRKITVSHSMNLHWFGAFSIHAWWRHHMETFSVWLAICAGNSPVTDEFPAQRPVTQSFVVFFYLRLNKRLGEQSWGWWSETPSRPLWRHCNDQ